MNKKLLTLAVAATLAAPAIASAEAIMYGKLNVSLDYQEIDNVIRPVYNNSAEADILVRTSAGIVTVPGSDGNDYFYYPDGTRAPVLFRQPDGTFAPFLPTGQALTFEQAQALQGTYRVAPGQLLPGTDFKGWGFSKGANLQGEGRASRLGVKGSEDLGNGLKAIYQIELGINFDTNNNVVSNSDTISYRNTFVGLAGDWGTFLMGRHDSPMKISTGKLDLFADTMADYNGTIGFNDYRFDQTVAYISPNWSGLQFAAAIVPGGAATAGAGQNWNDDGINEGYSLALIYSNGPFYASAAYESVSQDMLMDTSTSLNGCFPITGTADSVTVGGVDVALAGTQEVWTSFGCDKATDDYNKWRLGLGLLDWNGFTLTAIYENQENMPGSGSFQGVTYNDVILADGTTVAYLSDFSWYLSGGPDKSELWQIQAGYSFGNWMLKGMYGQRDFSGGTVGVPTYAETGANIGVYNSLYQDYYNGSSDSWALGVDYNFSKRTKAYMLYTQTNVDGGDAPTLTSRVGDGSPSGEFLTGIPGRTQWDGFSIGMMHSF
jgi:predicted porin